MATRPTNAGSRSCIKKHVTKWMDKIKDYQNVSVDLTIKNTLLGAETILRNSYNKFEKFSSGVMKDLESANATEEAFDIEQEYQLKMEEQFREALVIVKTKTDQYDTEQEEERKQREEKRQASERSLATLLGITQKLATASREQDRLAAEAAREQDRLAAEAAREQDRRDHQQAMQQRRDFIEKLINNLKAGLPVSALAVAENAAQNRKLPENSEITHGSAEKLIEKSAVSNNLNIHSVNQSFSLPERPATTLEKLKDGVSTVFNKKEIPDLAPTPNQHQIFTTGQETIPDSDDTTQPSPLEETAVTLSEVSTTTLEKLTEGASLAVIYEETPLLTMDHSDNQQSILFESIRPAEPIEGASSTTNQQEAPVSTPLHQNSSVEQTDRGCSEIQPSSFNHNSAAVSPPLDQPDTSLDKSEASQKVRLLFTLSDSTADRVIDDEITPKFRTPSGTTTKPQFSSKQYSVFKRKCLERVISTLQLRNESSSQLSLINPFTQVLKSVSQQLKNSLVKRVSEENARIHQSVWDSGGQTKPEVHQLLIGTATNGWKISLIKSPSVPANVQQVSSRYPADAVDHNEVEPYGTGSAWEYVGNRMVPNSDRLGISTSELYWEGIVYVL